MNEIIKYVLREIWLSFEKKYPAQEKVVYFCITRILWLVAFITTNFGMIVGIIKQICKVLAKIASLTPTKKDDFLVPQVESLFDSIQKSIYTAAESVVEFYDKNKEIIS